MKAASFPKTWRQSLKSLTTGEKVGLIAKMSGNQSPMRSKKPSMLSTPQTLAKIINALRAIVEAMSISQKTFQRRKMAVLQGLKAD